MLKNGLCDARAILEIRADKSGCEAVSVIINYQMKFFFEGRNEGKMKGLRSSQSFLFHYDTVE
jgi:hypothetical protein